jgi:putative phosphotransacetylase
MRIPVGVSARHVHLTKETFQKLFNQDDLTLKVPIKQPGLFAANETVTIKGPKGFIKNVRILGPFRSYNQVEVSKTDCYQLGINPPMRKSGDVKNAAPITIIGPKDSITLDVAILANRHIHITTKEAKKLGVKDDQFVDVKINSLKPGIIRAQYKVSDEAFKEIHLDTDDANAFLLKQDDEVEVLL